MLYNHIHQCYAIYKYVVSYDVILEQYIINS